jgi:hypothetical protein
MENTEAIGEIVRMDLSATEKMPSSPKLAVTARGIDEISRKNLATVESCVELVREMDNKMVEIFKIWNVMFEKRLQDIIKTAPP